MYNYIHPWLYLTGGVDYQFPRGSYTQVIVSGGADRVPFNITIYDDNILERTENFQLSIVDVFLPYGVIVGNRQSAEVVIFDDDRKYIYWMCLLHNVHKCKIAISFRTLFLFKIQFSNSQDYEKQQDCGYELTHQNVFTSFVMLGTPYTSVCSKQPIKFVEHYKYTIIQEYPSIPPCTYNLECKRKLLKVN